VAGAGTSSRDIALDGKRVAFLIAADKYATPNAVLITDHEGNVVSRSTFPSGTNLRGVYFVRRGELSELWLLAGKHSIERYATW
jgi:hypothetical protein